MGGLNQSPHLSNENDAKPQTYVRVWFVAFSDVLTLGIPLACHPLERASFSGRQVSGALSWRLLVSDVNPIKWKGSVYRISPRPTVEPSRCGSLDKGGLADQDGEV